MLTPSGKQFTGSCLSIVTAGLVFALSSSAGQVYSFQTLNNPNDPTFNQLLGINNSGEIAGYFGSGLTPDHPNRGYTLAPPYSTGSYTNENFPGSGQTQVIGINNNPSPTTVGFFVDAAGNNFGFVDQGSTFKKVFDPNSLFGGPVFNQLLGVNDKNVAAGFYTDANGVSHPYAYNIASGKFSGIAVPVGVSAFATGINNAGDISGYYTNALNQTSGFLEINGQFLTENDPSGSNTMLLGLNNKGEAVGSYVDQAGITEGLTYNFLTNSWTTVRDPLPSQLPAFGVTGTTVNGVNDNGQLVGFYSDGLNVDGFLATPKATTPEPASIGISAAGFLGLAWILKRKRVIRLAGGSSEPGA
jgi:hypothetical protein